MNGPLDRVAGDAPDAELAPLPPEIRMWAQYSGGDPTLSRVREVSVTVPTCQEDRLSDYAVIVRTTLRELGRLGALVAQETTVGYPGLDPVRVDMTGYTDGEGAP